MQKSLLGKFTVLHFLGILLGLVALTFYLDYQIGTSFERLQKGRELTKNALSEHEELSNWLQMLASSVDEVQYSVRLEQSLRLVSSLKRVSESQELEAAERTHSIFWLGRWVVAEDLLSLRVARNNWRRWEACEDALGDLKELNFSILRNLGVEGAHAKIQELTEECLTYQKALENSDNLLLAGMFSLSQLQTLQLRIAFILLFISSSLALIRLTRLTRMVRKLTTLRQMQVRTTQSSAPNRQAVPQRTAPSQPPPPSQPRTSSPTSQPTPGAGTDANTALIDLMNDEIIQVKNEKMLSFVLPSKQYQGQRFSDLIAEQAGEEAANNTRQFIDYLRMRNHYQAVIDRSNPLKQLTVTVTKNGQKANVTLHCRFRYLEPGKNRRKLQVQIRLSSPSNPSGNAVNSRTDQATPDSSLSSPNNITQPLKPDIKKDEGGTTSTIELSLIHDFLIDAREELHALLFQVTSSDGSREALQPLLEESFRAAHKMKGDAGMLSLNEIVDKAHQFEDKINAQLRGAGSDQMDRKTFSNDIAELEAFLASQMETSAKPSGESNQTVLNMSSITEHLFRRFQAYVDVVAKKYDKSTVVKNAGFNANDLPSDKAKDMISMILQLIRNATFHGIETREDRKKKGKPEQGNIHLTLTHSGGKTAISVRDDGRGLDLNQIRQAAKRLDLHKSDLDNLSTTALQQLIFSPGFSTSEHVDQNAGRGIGLDLVKSTVSKWGGTIEIATEAEKFCEFRLIIPR